MQSCGSLKTSELKIMRVDLYGTELRLLVIFSVFMDCNLSRKHHNDWEDVNGNVYKGSNDEIHRLTHTYGTLLLLSLHGESLSFCLKVSCGKVTYSDSNWLGCEKKHKHSKSFPSRVQRKYQRVNPANGLYALR